MADAMTLLDGAIAATLREAITEGTFDTRVKAAFYFARRSTEFEQDFDMSRAWPPYSEERLDLGSGPDGEHVERFREALEYDRSEGLASIWFDPAFVKPAVAGLAIWMDRMSSPENTTPISATIARTGPGRAAYDVMLLRIDYNAATTLAGAEAAARRRAGAALVAGAWWALNSSTAQRLGHVALAAEAERHRSTLAADEGGSSRHELGPSPYVILKEG